MTTDHAGDDSPGEIDQHSSIPTVLIVEDESHLADLYRAWLADQYDIRVANTGAEALDLFDEEVDVALLDRRLPDMSGDEVLTELRAQEYDCGVAMVTAVEPDFDILEMGFDDYLMKSFTRDELLTTVERLLELNTYDATLQSYFGLASKIAALETAKTESELAASEEYERLRSRFAEAEQTARMSLNTLFETGEAELTVRRLAREWDQTAKGPSDD